MPISTPGTALQYTQNRDVPCYSYTDTPIPKVYCITSVFEVVVQRWTFTISLPNFLFSDLYFCLYLYCLPEMQYVLHLTIIYHVEKKNARNKIRKVVFLSKMPLDKGSVAMGVEIKEIKRRSRAVKVTHPPADRRQLHKRMK